MVPFSFQGTIDPDLAALLASDPFDALPVPDDHQPGYPSDGFSNSARRPLRILILGDERDVTAMIGWLQQRGVAQRTEWSRLIPCRQAIDSIGGLLANLPADTVMGMLTRYFVD